MKTTTKIIGIGLITLAGGAGLFGIGYWLGGGGPGSAALGGAGGQAAFWTCSMHPQIQLPGPGKCPLCAMDLVPVTATPGHGNLGPRELALSPRAMQLADIQTFPVKRQFVTKTVRMVGKVEFDETRQAYITSWVPGRLDRLYVDYTGVPVKAGDHMVYLYSPELLEAQQELIQAIQTAAELEASPSSLLKERAELTIKSSRAKLHLWGLSEQQIQDIEQRKSPSDHITINAPISGIVIHKNALEGMYVNEGTKIYTIADLSHLWVKLDAYESDLPWIHYGQEVEFATEAYPGKVFRGRIAFIDPVLNSKTRTVKVRVNVTNPDGLLKPEMFIRATVSSQIAAESKVFDPSLAGKWISPMHPEIIKDGPGECDVCGMALVTAESLGYVPAASAQTNAPLVIPRSAPLITGNRAVVYVAVADKPGHFIGREITLGSRAGNFYIVKDGLSEGELVVANGNFKIDSAVQILAKPSMMSPEGGLMPGHHHGGHGTPPGAPPADAGRKWTTDAVVPHEVPAAFRDQLAKVLVPYYRMSGAMRTNSVPNLREGIREALDLLGQVDTNLLAGHAVHRWQEISAAVQQSLTSMEAKAIKPARADFAVCSERMAILMLTFGLAAEAPVYVMHCPMALGNQGAVWLQGDASLRNPYFSGAMLTCGTVAETLAPSSASPNQHQNPGEGRPDQVPLQQE